MRTGLHKLVQAGFQRHDPRYAGGIMPCPPDTWVSVAGHDCEVNAKPQQAKDLYWGTGSDCENPIWWWKRVNRPANTGITEPVRLRATVEVDYIFHPPLDGRSVEDIIQQFFVDYDLNRYHATRDMSQLGGSKKLVKIERVPL